MAADNLDNVVFALLFASDEPLSVRRLSAIAGDADAAEIRESIKRLGARIATAYPCIQLESVAGGWQLSTNPQYAGYIARLYSGRRKQRLSRAALETLAIIAYKQPVTRAEIENIRGVSCGGVLTTLMERVLIRIVGKARVLGAPFLYGTTQVFLEYLGINSLKDLPSMADLEALLEREESSQMLDESVSEVDGSVAAEETAPTDTTETESGEGGGARIDQAVTAGAPFTSPDRWGNAQERDVEKPSEEEAHESEAGDPQGDSPAKAPPDKPQTEN
jgi:segregation and condensation protein B